MKNLFNAFLLLFMCAILSFPCFAQGLLPEEALEAGRKQIKQMQVENPKLAKLHEELLNIQIEVRKIMTDFNKGKITKTDAKQKITPLLKREQEILWSQDFLVEQKLFALFSAPFAN
ncbi:MAG: hypothetical protein M0R20_04295 [Candidatus Omnitrophica bacterium]|jgi:hypothetical protein|nr:hypothetical protein [Candidatus Omnitrophota bacterium]